MHHKLADFLERPLINQQGNAFAGGQFPLGVLRVDAFLAATQQGFSVFTVKNFG